MQILSQFSELHVCAVIASSESFVLNYLFVNLYGMFFYTVGTDDVSSYFIFNNLEFSMNWLFSHLLVCMKDNLCGYWS